MAKTSTSSLLLVALICISAAAARTKLYPINDQSANDSICKTMVETQGFVCHEHKVRSYTFQAQLRYIFLILLTNPSFPEIKSAMGFR